MVARPAVVVLLAEGMHKEVGLCLEEGVSLEEGVRLEGEVHSALATQVCHAVQHSDHLDPKRPHASLGVPQRSCTWMHQSLLQAI